MDTGKLRLAAGAGAAVFGVVGTAVLAVGLVLALSGPFGLTGASFCVGGVLFIAAIACLFFITRPDRTAEEDVSKIETLTAEALADLPFETLKALIEKRPMAAMMLAATTGYGLSRDPEAALANFRKAVTGLM